MSAASNELITGGGSRVFGPETRRALALLLLDAKGFLSAVTLTRVYDPHPMTQVGSVGRGSERVVGPELV